MNQLLPKACAIALVAFLGFGAKALAQRQMEYLDRGLVAVNQGSGKIFLS